MYSFLPDELLKEILAPALQVPDDSFACTDEQSPFSNYNLTTSAYLLVCKDWLRVATPLLYNVVILRAKAQVQALESILISSPELAVYIKKLRLESGYCSSLLTVLKACKNATDFFVSLDVHFSDSISAFQKGLVYSQPHRLIIHDRPKRSTISKKTWALVTTLNDYIPKWDRLMEITLPGLWRVWNSPIISPEEFVGAVCQSQSIQVVTVEGLEYSVPPSLGKMAAMPCFRKIKVLSGESYLTSGVTSATVTTNTRLGSLLEFSNSRTEGIRRSPPPSMTEKFTGALGVATFPDTVWVNILLYILRLPEFEDYDTLKLVLTKESAVVGDFTLQRRKLALVCRKFHELCKQLFYRCLVADNSQQLEGALALISRNPPSGRRTRMVFTSKNLPGGIFAEPFKKLLTLLPNLQQFLALVPYPRLQTILPGYERIFFDWECLRILAQRAEQLYHLELALLFPSQPEPIDILSKFTALKYLHIQSSGAFSYVPADIDTRVFPELESITCQMDNDTFLVFLSALELPKINTANFPCTTACEGATTFLRAHGSKLRSLECGCIPGIRIFDVCPGLLVLEIPDLIPGPGVCRKSFFLSENEHPLQTLRVKYDTYNVIQQRKTFKCLATVDLSKFTSLREFIFYSCKWPTTENEIQRSHWVRWSDRIYKSYGINILDREGRKWVPRLQPRK